jgi:hypothetical protein
MSHCQLVRLFKQMDGAAAPSVMSRMVVPRNGHHNPVATVDQPGPRFA